VVIPQVCCPPPLTEANLTPGCTCCGVLAQRYWALPAPQVVSNRAMPSWPYWLLPQQ
jgi:hypothetical protein